MVRVHMFRFVRITLACVFLKTADGASTCEQSAFVWPLGKEIGIHEIKQNVVNGTRGAVTFGTGPTELNYDAMQFAGNSSSYVDLDVPSSSVLVDSRLNNDYSLQMYIYLDNTSSGTLFQYKGATADSAGASTDKIYSYIAYLSSGSVVLEIANFGSDSYAFQLQKDMWYHLIFERDWINQKVRIYKDITNSRAKTFAGLNEKLTDFPGTLRIGGSLDGSRPSLNGRVACVQFIPGKQPITGCVDYDAECMTSQWPSTTPTTTSTTTFPTTTSTTTFPTTTSTTTFPTTTSTTTTPTTPSTTTTSTMTSTTTTPTTTSTTTFPTSTSTTTTPTTPSTTATSTTTSTTTTPTTTSTTAAQTTSMSPTTTAMPSSFSYDVIERCITFGKADTGVTFANSADIIESTVVDSVAECSNVCVRNTDCIQFVVKDLGLGLGIYCLTGVSTSNVKTEQDTVLYKLR